MSVFVRSCSLFVAVLLLIPALSNNREARIVSSPQSVNVSSGDYAVFNCTAIASFINWAINGTTLNNEHKNKGFEQQQSILLDRSQNLLMRSLIVLGSPASNNTSIVCVAHPDLSSGGQLMSNKSEAALLLVQVPINGAGPAEPGTHSEIGFSIIPSSILPLSESPAPTPTIISIPTTDYGSSTSATSSTASPSGLPTSETPAGNDIISVWIIVSVPLTVLIGLALLVVTSVSLYLCLNRKRASMRLINGVEGAISMSARNSQQNGTNNPTNAVIGIQQPASPTQVETPTEDQQQDPAEESSNASETLEAISMSVLNSQQNGTNNSEAVILIGVQQPVPPTQVETDQQQDPAEGLSSAVAASETLESNLVVVVEHHCMPTEQQPHLNLAVKSLPPFSEQRHVYQDTGVRPDSTTSAVPTSSNSKPCSETQQSADDSQSMCQVMPREYVTEEFLKDVKRKETFNEHSQTEDPLAESDKKDQSKTDPTEQVKPSDVDSDQEEAQDDSLEDHETEANSESGAAQKKTPAFSRKSFRQPPSTTAERESYPKHQSPVINPPCLPIGEDF